MGVYEESDRPLEIKRLSDYGIQHILDIGENPWTTYARSHTQNFAEINRPVLPFLEIIKTTPVFPFTTKRLSESHFCIIIDLEVLPCVLVRLAYIRNGTWPLLLLIP